MKYSYLSVFDTMLYESTTETGIVSVPDRNKNVTENDVGNKESPPCTGGISNDETDDYTAYS